MKTIMLLLICIFSRNTIYSQAIGFGVYGTTNNAMIVDVTYDINGKSRIHLGFGGSLVNEGDERIGTNVSEILPNYGTDLLGSGINNGYFDIGYSYLFPIKLSLGTTITFETQNHYRIYSDDRFNDNAYNYTYRKETNTGIGVIVGYKPIDWLELFAGVHTIYNFYFGARGYLYF